MILDLFCRIRVSGVGAKVAILGITFKENCPDLQQNLVY